MTYDHEYFADLDEYAFDSSTKREERRKLRRLPHSDRPRRKRGSDTTHNGIWRRRLHRIV